MKEFYDEYIAWGCKRTPEGLYSWQHLLMVTLFVGVAIALAIIIGRKNRNKTMNEKLKVTKIMGLVMIGFEIIKIILEIIRRDSFFCNYRCPSTVSL